MKWLQDSQVFSGTGNCPSHSSEDCEVWINVLRKQKRTTSPNSKSLKCSWSEPEPLLWCGSLVPSYSQWASESCCHRPLFTGWKGLSSRPAFAAQQRRSTAAAGTDSRWPCKSHWGHSVGTQRWVCRRVSPSSSSTSCGRARWDSCQAEASCSHAGWRRWPPPWSSLTTPRDEEGQHGGEKTPVNEAR